MSYDTLRHLADSYGLLFMAGTFLTLIGWTFRRGSRAAHERARLMIFEERGDD